MKTIEYIQTNLFRKYNECVVLTYERKEAEGINPAECLKLGRLIEKDIIKLDKSLLDAVRGSNQRFAKTLEPNANLNFNEQYLYSAKLRQLKEAEVELWARFEEPNKATLSQLEHVRVSRDQNPPGEVNIMFAVIAGIMAFWWLKKETAKKDTSDKDKK